VGVTGYNELVWLFAPTDTKSHNSVIFDSAMTAHQADGAQTIMVGSVD
jgi:hypothetical protein